MQINLEIKVSPLSVNKAWQGRRFKSDAYKQFIRDVSIVLPVAKNTIKNEVEIYYTFYIKNFGNADVDNLIKTAQDQIVEKRYIIDDRKIIFLQAKKIKVKNYQDEKIEITINERPRT